MALVALVALAAAAPALWPRAPSTTSHCTEPTLAMVQRGKQIYLRGESPSGDPLTVTLDLFGDATRTIPGSRYACVHCHGTEGLPSVEGGVAVPDIRPQRLAAELHAGGNQPRARRPYDAAAIGRAIRFGCDASGNPLHPLMPRFDISTRDLADLQAYLAQLGRAAVPGVTPTEIALVTIVPDDPAGVAAAATLRAAVADANREGGIYGRRLRVDVLHPAEFAALSEGPAAADAWLAVVYASGPALTVEPPLPVIGAVAEDPLVDPPLLPEVFWLPASQATQLCVAVDDACGESGASAVATAFALIAEAVDPAIEAALRAQVARHDGSELVVVRADEFSAMAARERLVVLLAGPPEWKGRLLPMLLARGDVAAVYAPHRLPASALAALGADALGRLRLLLPVPVPDERDPALAAFRGFLARHVLPEAHLGTRVAVLAAVASCTEALERCGANVTRERLLRELGALQSFRPGLFPPLSYDLNHRVGAAGAQVVGIDPVSRTLQPRAPWRRPL